MRWNRFTISLAIASVLTSASSAMASGFGTVVPIGGTASDIALDESRGLLYIANFGANVIQVMSTADNTIHTSINVAAQPGALALSADSQYLLIAHYGNFTSAPTNGNLITLIHLSDNRRQTFATGDPPLGVAFLANGLAMIVTTTGFLSFDPVSGQMSVLSTFANLAQALPIVQNTFPGQILETALTTSADGMSIWGIAGGGTGNQVIYKYSARSGQLSVTIDVSSPALLPRVSVAADGSYALIGWALFSDKGYLQGRYPNVIDSKTITGHAIDSKNGIVYAQIPDASQPIGPAFATSSPAGTAPSAKLPALLIMDADNLTVRDRITIPENMVGKTAMNAAASVLYAISDSGVMVLPVGALNQYPRIGATQEDLLVQTNFCNRNTVAQTLTITDPGGGNTDFTITPSQPGVTVSPSSGMTPATVQIRVDPSFFQNANGTTAVSLKLSSAGAINQPRPVRLLMNNPDSNQRGTVVDVPGNLTDILPDPARNRFYVLRQDKNQLLVFDGSTNSLIATLRTATSPTMMAITNDQGSLLVGHDDSQLIMVYDLNSLQPQLPIVLPGGHYARSIAQSNGATLVMARDEATSQGVVDSINFLNRSASKLPSLGIFTNTVAPTSVLTPSPNGSTILLASPDGNVMLYSAVADTFTISRQDIKALSGSFAASSYNSYVIGSHIFNASLVPQGSLTSTGATPSGFAFVNQGGYLAAAASPSSPGVIQNLPTLQSAAVRPVLMSEAPLMPTVASGAGSGNTGTAAGAVTATAGSGAGSISAYNLTAFTRTVAPLPSAGRVIVLTTSGFTVLAANYDAAVALPAIASVVNAANGQQPVAPGGLISVFGQQMSPVNMATSQIPLPTALGDSCLSVNGAPVPLLFVSTQQINAQLPFNVAGNATLTVHTPGGVSNNYLFAVQTAAPSVFLSGTAGPQSGLAAIVRAENNQLVTPTNPIHPKDTVVIYLTGMGMTTPQVDAGLPSPSSPLAAVSIPAVVTLGGATLDVSYAGLVPGEVGVYQINAYVPSGVPQGLDLPLVINQGGGSTTLNVRVVK